MIHAGRGYSPGPFNVTGGGIYVSAPAAGAGTTLWLMNGAPTTRAIVGGVISYESSDEELVISEIGRRIDRILGTADPKQVEAVLTQAGRNGGINTSYGKIIIHRANAAGTGPVYYADAPLRTPIAFKRMRPF